MTGSLLAVVASAAVAAARTLAVFLAAHTLVGVAFACLLSAGFSGVATFPPERRGWAIGYVAGANALAWIVVNPVAGLLTDAVSWRAAGAAPALLAVGALVAALGLRAPRLAGASLPPQALLGEPSARRWLVAELLAYGAWTALLTFAGAFFIQRFGIGEALAGWALAAGAAAYFLASTRSGRLVARVARRRLVVGAALAMAVLLPLELTAVRLAAVAVTGFCLIGLVAGVRTPASSGLGLAQLPDHPGAMMSARTAATQFGYLVGAVVGGALLTGPGYAALGAAMAIGMAASALLVLRVEDAPAAAVS